MHLSDRLRWHGVLFACLVLQGISGCGGMDPIAVKDRQIEELEYQSDRQKESLVELLGETQQLHVRLEGLEAERETLANKVQKLEANLRYANEQIEASHADENEASETTARLQRTIDSLRTSLSKVKSEGSALANELAELRVMRQKFERDIQVLKREKSSLIGRNGDLTQERNRLQDDLVRAHAVVRSLQEGKGLDSVLGVSPEEFTRLEKENKELKKREADLQRKVNYLLASSSSGNDDSDDTATSGAVLYENDPEGLWDEVVALFQTRLQLARRGEIAWDVFDITVTGVAGVFLLLVIWTTIRWIRIRRLARRVRTLSARIVELEQLQAEGSGVLGGAQRPARTDSGPGRGRRAPAMRRSGFSAVISSKGTTPRAERPPQPEQSRSPKPPPVEEQPADPPAKVVRVQEVNESTPPKGHPLEEMKASADEAPPMSNPMSDETPVEAEELETVGVGVGISEPSPRVGSVGSPRRTIGARTWQEEAAERASPPSPEPSGKSSAADLASTQIIPGMSQDSSPADSLPSIEPRIGQKPLAEAGTADEGTRKEKGKEESEDGLLDELRNVIHQKFDELLK